jgi:hypothetical protein
MFLDQPFGIFYCGNNSFWIKSTPWVIFHTCKCFTLSFVYTWISNEITHCVNSSVTWWPQNFNHVNFFESPRSRVCPFVVSKAIRLLATLVLLCSCHSWINCLPKLNFLCLRCYLDVFHVSAQNMFPNTPSMRWPWNTRSSRRSIFPKFSLFSSVQLEWRS